MTSATLEPRDLRETGGSRRARHGRTIDGPLLVVGAPEGMAYDQVYAEGLSGLFDRLVRDLRAPRDTKVETVRLRGEPASALADLMAEHDFDLVAAGIRSVPRAATHLTGSVSTALVRGSVRSVLLASQSEAH
ncbi:MAG: universal stress protein [bacterium]